MYDLEVFVGDPYPEPSSKESSREAWTSHREREIWMNLTRIWQLSHPYATFLDEFIGMIIHEFLHCFMYVNKIEQEEEAVSDIAITLLIPSLGHLIGAGEEETEEDRRDFQKWVYDRFAVRTTPSTKPLR